MTHLVQSPTRQRRISQKHYWALLCLLAGGLLDGLTNMYLGWAWPIWLAPVFYLRSFDYLGHKRAFWAVGLVGIISGIISVALTLPMLLAEVLITVPIMSFLASGIYWSYHKLSDRIPGFQATLLLPVFATLLDYLFSWINPFGSITSGAYYQHSLLPLTQLVSLTGIWGITFLVSWFAATVHYIWKDNLYHHLREWAVAWPFLLILSAVLLYGEMRLSQPTGVKPVLIVAGVTAPRETWVGQISVALSDNSLNTPDQLAHFQQSSEQLYDHFQQATQQAQAQGAQLVVWNESAIPVLVSDLEKLKSRLTELSQELNIYLAATTWVVGQPLREPGDPPNGHNRLLLYNPSGELLLEYDKHILVPGNEVAAGIPGMGEVKAIETSLGKLSGLICYDVDFPNYVRAVGQQDIELLIVPGADSQEITPFHTYQSYFRAIENGCSLVRIATGGLSGVV
ncbi:MAG: nitrilase-related carbon-nitrogen hydrolase, partial [Bacteroidota bacterium]